jgi:hypothetical protein
MSLGWSLGRQAILVLLSLGVIMQPALANLSYECKADLTVGYSFDESARSWTATNFRPQGHYIVRKLTDDEMSDLLYPKGATWGVFTDQSKAPRFKCTEPQEFYRDGLMCGVLADHFMFSPMSLDPTTPSAHHPDAGHMCVGPQITSLPQNSPPGVRTGGFFRARRLRDAASAWVSKFAHPLLLSACGLANSRDATADSLHGFRLRLADQSQDPLDRLGLSIGPAIHAQHSASPSAGIGAIHQPAAHRGSAEATHRRLAKDRRAVSDAIPGWSRSC